jgi:hypothetical protein
LLFNPSIKMSPTETTTETTSKSLFTLPPHLQTALSALSAAGIAPPSLQTELERTLSAAEEEVYEDEGEVAAAREIVAGAKAKARPTLRDSTLGSGPGGSNGDKGEQEGEKGEKEPTDGDGIDDKEPEAETKPRPTRRPATIDGALLDEIARWAGRNEASLKRARLGELCSGDVRGGEGDLERKGKSVALRMDGQGNGDSCGTPGNSSWNHSLLSCSI